MIAQLVAMYILQQNGAAQSLRNKLSNSEEFFLFHSVTLDIEKIKRKLVRQYGSFKASKMDYDAYQLAAKTATDTYLSSAREI